MEQIKLDNQSITASKIEIDESENPELAAAVNALRDYALDTILSYDEEIREAFRSFDRTNFDNEVKRAINDAVTGLSRGELTSELAEKEEFSVLYAEMFTDHEFAENLYSEISDILYAEHTRIAKARETAHKMNTIAITVGNQSGTNNTFDVTSVGFDAEKRYTVAEFNQALKKANEIWKEGWDGLSHPHDIAIVTVENLHTEPCTYRINLADVDYGSIQDIVRLSPMPIHASISTDEALERLNKAETIPLQRDISHKTTNADLTAQTGRLRGYNEVGGRQKLPPEDAADQEVTAIRGESRGKIMEQNTKFEVSTMSKLEGSGAKAIATLVVNGEFAIHGVTVNEKQDGSGLYVRMPSEKENGEYKDVVFPITAEARKGINNAILGAYEQLAASPEKTIKNEISTPDKPVSKVFAQMSKVESKDKATIAAGQLKIDDCLVVKDILLNKVAVKEKTADGQEQPNAADGQEKTKLIVAMPNKPTERKSHDEIAHAITPEFRAKIDKAVIASANNIGRYEYKGVKYAELGENPAKTDPLKNAYADKVMTELDNAGITYQAKCEKEGAKTVVISVKEEDKQSLKNIINELDQKGRVGGKKSLSEQISKAKEQQSEKTAEQPKQPQPHRKPNQAEL